MKKQIKAIGYVTEAKEAKRNGEPVGIVEGYLATWDVDRGNDQFIKGCFTGAIEDLQEKRRPLRLKRNHFNLIGGFPENTLKQDDVGLFGVGEINLNTQEGAEAFSLARQGVLSDFSVGWSWENNDVEMVDGIRQIKRSGLWEASIVDEPMNPKAIVTDVKTVTPRAKLPKSFAEQNLRWDAAAAVRRWREKSGSEDEPSESYRNGFLFYDPDNTDNFAGYKLPVVDVVDGSAVIVPRAVFAVRAALAGARGGVNLPEKDRTSIRGIINTLYREMDLEEPFDGEEDSKLHLTEARCLPDSYLYDILKANKLSRKAIEWLIACRPSMEDEPKGNEIDDETEEIAKGLTEIANILRGE